MKNIRSLLPVLFTVILPAYIHAQDMKSSIARIDDELRTNKTTIPKILSTDSLMYLHSQAAFRELIKKYAKAEKITIVSPREPGTKILVKASVTDKQGNAVKNALVYVYQTSDKGWYSDTAAHILINEGDMRHARLFGYFKTDDQGSFSFETIRPRGYPNSDLPAHIHIHFWSKEGTALSAPGELLFDDDPRLTTERRKTATSMGFPIIKNSGTEKDPVYEYKLPAVRY